MLHRSERVRQVLTRACDDTVVSSNYVPFTVDTTCKQVHMYILFPFLTTLTSNSFWLLSCLKLEHIVT